MSYELMHFHGNNNWVSLGFFGTKEKATFRALDHASGIDLDDPHRDANGNAWFHIASSSYKRSNTRIKIAPDGAVVAY